MLNCYEERCIEWIHIDKMEPPIGVDVRVKTGDDSYMICSMASSWFDDGYCYWIDDDCNTYPLFEYQWWAVI